MTVNRPGSLETLSRFPVSGSTVWHCTKVQRLRTVTVFGVTVVKLSGLAAVTVLSDRVKATLYRVKVTLS